MATELSKIEAGNLFRVDDLIAVVTGGGSGKLELDSNTNVMNERLTAVRSWENDGTSSCDQRGS